MDFDPRTLANDYIKFGDEWVEKNYAADVLEEAVKTLESQLSTKFFEEAKSMERSKMMARASKEYEEHVKLMLKIRREANKAKVRYDAHKAYIELVRSQESTNRATMMIR